MGDNDVAEKHLAVARVLQPESKIEVRHVNEILGIEATELFVRLTSDGEARTRHPFDIDAVTAKILVEESAQGRAAMPTERVGEEAACRGLGAASGCSGTGGATGTNVRVGLEVLDKLKERRC